MTSRNNSFINFKAYLFNKPVSEDAEMKYLTQGVTQIADSTKGIHIQTIDLETLNNFNKFIYTYKIRSTK